MACKRARSEPPCTSPLSGRTQSTSSILALFSSIQTQVSTHRSDASILIDLCIPCASLQPHRTHIVAHNAGGTDGSSMA